MTHRSVGWASIAARTGSYPSTRTLVSSSARASAERGPSSKRPSSPKSEPSSSTATSDSRPSGELVRMAMRPLTMPNSSWAGSPWRNRTSLRATVRMVDC